MVCYRMDYVEKMVCYRMDYVEKIVASLCGYCQVSDSGEGQLVAYGRWLLGEPL